MPDGRMPGESEPGIQRGYPAAAIASPRREFVRTSLTLREDFELPRLFPAIFSVARVRG